MRPDVGSGAYATIFESETDVLIANLQHEVANTIGRFEPRVILQNVTVVRGDPNDPTTPDTAVTVTIEYLVISTAKMQSLTLTLGGP